MALWAQLGFALFALPTRPVGRYTLVELVSWDASQDELTDRCERPWDNPHRRPSHADKRRTIARQMLKNRFLACLPKRPEFRKIRASIADLISLSV